MIVFFLFLLSILIYWYLSQSDPKKFFQDIDLAILNGLILASIASIIGLYFQRIWSDDLEKRELKKDLALLQKLAQRIFIRDKSGWNFNNKTSKFYFDGSWINSLYSLFIDDNRQWEKFLLSYKNSFEKNVPNLIKMTSDFLNEMEIALIEAERLDSKLRSEIINPSIAAKKESGYRADRDQADYEAQFDYLVYRAI